MNKKAFPFLLLFLASHAGVACDSYESVSKDISKKYHEEKLFTGYGKNPSELYEFWGNSKSKSWTLIKRKVFVLDGKTKECATLPITGKSYVVANTPHASAYPDVNGDSGIFLPHKCITPADNSLLMWQRYSELPAIHAVGKGQSVTVYTSPASWTLIRVQLVPSKSSWCVSPGFSGGQSFFSTVSVSSI